VFKEKRKRASYTQLLSDTVQEEEELEWTQQDLRNMQLQFYKKRLKSNRLVYLIYENSVQSAQSAAIQSV
jgi:hypothetical protein